MPAASARNLQSRRRNAAGVAAVLCGVFLVSTHAYNLSPSERDAAERIAMISHSNAARAKLQTLLQLDQIDEDAHTHAPLLSMLTGVGDDRQTASIGEEWTSMLDKVTSRQGAGFKVAFYPGNSTVYNPMVSKTFQVVPKQMFLLQYADNSALKGFQSRDIVRLGDYSVEAKFGSITDCNSPDFNGVDGIAGFGMPVKTPPAPAASGGGMMGMMGGMGGQQPAATLPQPLLFAMSDPLKRNGGKNDIKMLQRRAFSFLSTDCNTTHSHAESKARDCKAEIQLGGYDPASVEGKMLLTPSITTNDYVVVALSLKFGTTELLDFVPTNPRLRYLPAIMDSGTSCLVIPDSTLSGLLKSSPYAKWKSMVKHTHAPVVKEDFQLNIAGSIFEISYDDWWLSISNQSCVQRAPPGFGGLLVGDVLFRRYVVLFDLRHYPETVVIGIGKQSTTYVPASKHATITKLSAKKRVPVNVSTTHAPPGYKVPYARDRVAIHNQEMTQYFINVSVGTPAQTFTVIFDTGSAVFGLFTKCIPKAPTYGTCTFGGGGAAGDAYMLIEGAVWILTFAVLASVIGIFINIYYHKRQDAEERLARKKARGKGSTSNSSFGPERLAGMYGSIP